MLCVFSNGKIVSVNSHVLRLTGLSENDIHSGITIDQLIQSSIDENIIYSDSKEPTEVIIKKKDGTTFLAEVSTKSPRWMNNQFFKFIFGYMHIFCNRFFLACGLFFSLPVVFLLLLICLHLIICVHSYLLKNLFLK